MKVWLHLVLLVALTPATAAAEDMHPRVRMQTTQGEIVLELDREKAPQTVANFVAYVQDGFYDGTIFHRVIDGFMIQGGGYTEDYTKKPTRAPIKNEADNGLNNVRGSIAMARTNDPNSATSQFFINVFDNTFLNHGAMPDNPAGYAVFGKVVSGMDTVDRIRQLPTGPGGPFRKEAPKTAVVIEKVTLE